MKNAISEMIESFRKACKPFTPLEEICFRVTEAGKDLADTSKPEHERYNSAIRLLCSIPAIDNHLSEAARNQIWGRAGVMPQPSDDSPLDLEEPIEAQNPCDQRRMQHEDSGQCIPPPRP